MALAAGFLLGARLGGTGEGGPALFDARRNNPGTKLQRVLDLVEGAKDPVAAVEELVG